MGVGSSAWDDVSLCEFLQCGYLGFRTPGGGCNPTALQQVLAYSQGVIQLNPANGLAGEGIVLVISHRGASGHPPENTPAAFCQAVSLGAPFIEKGPPPSRGAHFLAIPPSPGDSTPRRRPPPPFPT